MPTFYIFKRLGLTLITILSATFLTFVMLRMTPGDPAELILKKVFVGTEDYVADQNAKAEIENRLGLTQPLWRQYYLWLAQAVHGDFGHSFASGQRVNEEILLRIGPTVTLGLLAMGLSLLLTIGLAAMMGRFQTPWLQAVLDTGIVTSIALPNFYLALILMLIFSLHLDLLPISGYGEPAHYVLPVMTLGFTLFGYTTTILNDSVKNIRHQAFILTARSKGLAPAAVFNRHILRNAMIPVVPYVALQLGYMLGGVVIVESIFSWPGVGNYLVQSIQTRDVPVIQACIAFIALAFSCANLLADLALWLIDPRIRF